MKTQTISLLWNCRSNAIPFWNKLSSSAPFVPAIWLSATKNVASHRVTVPVRTRWVTARPGTLTRKARNEKSVHHPVPEEAPEVTHEHIAQYQHFNELFYQLVEISDTLCQAHIRLQRERNFNGDAEARLGKWKRNLISDARQTYLQLAENLEGFLRRMHSVAETLDFAERQRIVRLLVKEVLLVRTKLSLVIQFGFPNRLVAAVKFRQTPAKSASKVKITFR